MNKNNKKPLGFTHDQFFRTSMSDKRVARDFLRSWLPTDLCEQINFDFLELVNRSYVNDVRKESIVDALFRTSIQGHETYLYLLLEHQSKPDKLMPFRILKYTCNIIDEHLKKNNTKKIPLIYPIVIYHGKQKYPYSNNINDLVDAPNTLVDKYFLKPLHLIDLGQIDDTVIKQHLWSGVIEFALKHIFERDFLPYLKSHAPDFHNIVVDGGGNIVGIMLQYVLECGNLSDTEEFIDIIDTQISPEVGGIIMTGAEQLLQKGRVEGRVEGLELGREEGRRQGEQNKQLEIAIRLLEVGADLQFIEQITGINSVKLKKIKQSTTPI